MSVGIYMRLMEVSQASPDQSKKRECQKSDEPAAVLDSLGPITPDSARVIGDFPVDFKSLKSQTTLLNNKVASFDSKCDRDEDPLVCIDDGSPRTPKDDVFDPFAPGPDDLALAPLCNKYLHVSKGIIARRLNFDFSSIEAVEEEAGAQPLSDEEMLESVYENLLQVIISKQTEGLLSGISHVDCDSDGCRTPPSAPRLSGVADTCPGAPMKPTGKPRNIDLGLCRKLDF
jgi:hypothetical protein